MTLARHFNWQSCRCVRVFGISSLALALSGCATTSTGDDDLRSLVDANLRSDARALVVSPADAGPVQPQARRIGEVEGARAEPLLVRGSDKMVAAPVVRPGVSVQGAAVSLQFEQAPIADVIHAVYGDVLGLPYVISDSVTGNVTIRSAKPLAREEVLPVMESLLAANGLAAVQDSAGVFHIGTAEALRNVAPTLTLPGRQAAGQRVVVVPLQYISAAEMAEILTPVAREDSFVRVDGFRNLLLMSGTSTQLQGWLEIVRLFDVDVLQGMSVGLFPLENISVKEAEAALSLLLSDGAAGVSASSGATSRQQQQQRQGDSISAPSTLAGPLAGVVRFVAIERMNAILVVTSRSHYLEQVRTWIARFDVRRENLMESRLFVYPVQNGTATHLASLLSAVFGGGGGGGQSTTASSGVAPGLSLSGGMDSVPSASTSGVATASVSGIELMPNVRIVADEQNNAILIYAPGEEYRKIEAALRDLDQQPSQVLIEANIIEVTLNDSLKYGLQWYFHGGIGSNYRGEGILNLRASGGLAMQQPGFSYAVQGAGGDIRAVLNALADKSLLKVISSPSVLVLDNQTAQIHVGNQQPVRSSTTTTDAGRQTSSIEYKDTGVQLSVTPSVNAGRMVALDVSQVVTDVGNIDAATGQRTFLQRYVNSKIAARSGETIVLGGLIRDNTTRGRQGIPILHDLPIVGNLFGATDVTRGRTELLVTLTPRVLENEVDLRGIGEELRRKMRGVDRFIGDLRQQVGVEQVTPALHHDVY